MRDKGKGMCMLSERESEEVLSGPDSVVGDEFPVYEEAIVEILVNYRKQRLKERLSGPIISFSVHALILLLLVFVVLRQVEEQSIDDLPNKRKVVSVPQEFRKPGPRPISESLDSPDPDGTDSLSPFSGGLPNTGMPKDLGKPSIEDPFAGLTEALNPVGTDDTIGHISPVLTQFSGFVNSGWHRSVTRRKEAVRKGGGSRAGQRAVSDGLKWLALVQNDDGSWGTRNKPAFTGLAILTFLAHGETTELGSYQETVLAGLKYLAGNMPCDKPWDRAYSHGIATYALADAYAATRLPLVYSAMQCGIQTIIRGQQEHGGFDYGFSKGKRWDMSVTGWQLQALMTAKAAGATTAGLDGAILNGIDFLKDKAYGEGSYGYSNTRGGSATLAGCGTFCLELGGEGDSREVTGGTRFITEHRLKGYKWENARTDLYGWYYDTQAMYHHGGRSWTAWRRAFEKVLVKAQHKDGYWEVEGGHFGTDLTGRVFATTLSMLQLMVYYRHSLPNFDDKAIEPNRVTLDIEADLDNIREL